MSPLPQSLMSVLAPEVADAIRGALADAHETTSEEAWQRVVDTMREAEVRYRVLIENVPVAIYVSAFDETHTLRYISPRIAGMIGRTADELLADDEEWYRSIHPDDVERVRAAERVSYENGAEFDCEYRMVHRDGRVVFVWEHDAVVRDDAGRPLFSQGLVMDITPVRTAEAALRAERDRAQRYLDVAGVTLLVIDMDGSVAMLNRTGHALFGYEDGALLGADYFDSCLPEDSRERLREAFMRRMEADQIDPEAEIEIRRRDGSTRTVIWRTNVMREDGRPTGLLCSGTDITERLAAERQIAHLAYHDSLTGLPNRAMLRQHLDVALARSRRGGTAVALLYLDLDDFKLVNDGLGHAAGDELLATMAGRLRARLRQEDLVAREGGDEFLVLLADLGDDVRERALAVGETLAEALREPVRLAGTEFEISGSVGVSIFPRDASDAEGLLAHADSAMYEAKGAGRGQVRAFHGRRHRDPERLSMSRRLRRALEEDELVLHWQPIVTLETGLLKGAEALVRWQDPQRGLLAAGAFVADMDAAGLLDTLDEWVAVAFAAQRRAWHAEGLAPYVGFNLGPRSLNPGRVGRILECLDAGGVGLDRVTIEISESEVLREGGLVGDALRRLRDAGITLALDDFGVAYSSLSRLRDVPAEWIKVDKAFLRGVPEDPAATALLDAILGLLGALEARTIVEGVESSAQVRHLLGRGCETAQGFHLGRPMPAQALEPLLRASPDSVPAVADGAARRACGAP